MYMRSESTGRSERKLKSGVILFVTTFITLSINKVIPQELKNEALSIQSNSQDG